MSSQLQDNSNNNDVNNNSSDIKNISSKHENEFEGILLTCRRCKMQFDDNLNSKGECVHSGKWHETFDDCNKLQCTIGLGTKIGKQHWSCCFSVEYDSVCPKSGKHEYDSKIYERNFTGTWKAIKYKNFENYLKDEGYSYIARKIATVVDSTLTVVQQGNIINLVLGSSILKTPISFAEDTDHGNMKNPWIVDGKQHMVKGESGHNVRRHCWWENEKKRRVKATSYDMNKHQLIKYELFIDKKDRLSVKRTNANNTSTKFIYERVLD
eukprot:178893_1